ncbi:MAG: zinc-ribbon domain-containing protein [Vibrio sp.]
MSLEHSNQCLQCQHPIDLSALHRRVEVLCPQCNQRHQIKAQCDKCSEPVERLNACGSVSYFCHHCNELKSKSNVNLTLFS